MQIYNLKNREELARKVIDSWDMNTIMSYAFQQLLEAYKKDITLFNSDCELMDGE